MHIQAESDAIQRALEIITKTAPPLEGEVTFRSKKGRLTVQSVADLSRATVLVPCKVDGDGEFAILMQTLRDATKGRKAIDLKYVEGMLTVKSGAYKAELATMDVIPPDEPPSDKTKDWELTAEQATWLRQALKDVTLKPTSILSSWMPVGIKLSDKGGFVCCFDNQHMSWISSRSLVGDFEAVLPLDTVKSVVDVFHATNFTLQQGKSYIKVKNKMASVILAVPNNDDIQTLESVRAKIKEAMSIGATTFSLNQKDLATFIDNARSVVGKERAEIQVTSGKGKTGQALELLVKTGQGTVKGLVRGGIGKTKNGGDGEKVFRVDLEYIQELLGRSADEMALNVVEEAFLSLKLNGAQAIVALNQ